MKFFLMVATSLCAAALLVGCANAPRTTALVAPLTAQTLVTESNPLFRAVAVGQITGGRETGLVGDSQVSNAAFAQALSTSLNLALLRADPVRDAPRYRLDAQIVSLEQPQLQIAITATATIAYRLRRVSDDAVVFEETISTQFTAELRDTLIRAERFRLAAEGAVQENVAQFMNRLVAFSQRAPYELI